MAPNECNKAIRQSISDSGRSVECTVPAHSVHKGNSGRPQRASGAIKAPSLIWSNELARYAQEWADRLVEAGRLVHRPNPIYGENLFLIHGADVSPAAVVGAWASEARNYSYQTNSCQGRCGHYTQLIWRDTKRVGCGAASRDGTEVWVCNYDPPGNIAGERPY